MGGCCSRGNGQESEPDTEVKGRRVQTETDPLIAKQKDSTSVDTDKLKSNKNNVEASSSASSSYDDLDDLHRVKPSELGGFVLKKMNSKTLDRLWKHLDEDGSGQIERDEVL
eukprot:398780_1